MILSQTMKKIIALCILCIACFSLFTGCANTDYSHYSNYRKELPGAKEILPDTEYFSLAEKAHFKHDTKKMVLFKTETIQLQLDMNDGVYQTEKSRLLSVLTFQQEPPVNDFGKICITENQFSINNYEFYLLKTPSTEYPHQFGFVGFNDKTHKIAFLYCYDPDLDYVNSEDFIQKYYKLK